MDTLIQVQEADFDLQREYSRLRVNNPGAIVTFTGLVRDFNRDQAPDTAGVDTLTLQHYPGMTEKLLAGIVDEARERWPVTGVTVIHRVGTLTPGDQIVLVAVSADHRQEAFEAAEFLMDYLKTRATFWKKVNAGGEDVWVDMHQVDKSAASRWEASGGGADRDDGADI